MGKIKCLCGNIISDTCGEHGEAFAQNQVQQVGFLEQDYYPSESGRGIMECEKCGSLLIEDPIGSPSVKFYIPENKKCNHLFIEKDSE